MNRRITYLAVLILCFFLLSLVSGCFKSNSLTGKQHKVLEQLLACEVEKEQIEMVEIKQETFNKFQAVDKMFKISTDEADQYGVIVSPIGYRSPINTMVVIDCETDQVLGIKVIQHDESPDYGDWLGEEWFSDRFKGKKADVYLERVILEAEKPNEIIQITGATISSQAVLNGVNAAMGTYREIVKGEEAEEVPLKINIEEYSRDALTL